jgi:hypothetical protein
VNLHSSSFVTVSFVTPKELSTSIVSKSNKVNSFEKLVRQSLPSKVPPSCITLSSNSSEPFTPLVTYSICVVLLVVELMALVNTCVPFLRYVTWVAREVSTAITAGASSSLTIFVFDCNTALLFVGFTPSSKKP